MELPAGQLTRWLREAIRAAGPGGATVMDLVVYLRSRVPPENAIQAYMRTWRVRRQSRRRGGSGVRWPDQETIPHGVSTDQMVTVGLRIIATNNARRMRDVAHTTARGGYRSPGCVYWFREDAEALGQRFAQKHAELQTVTEDGGDV